MGQGYPCGRKRFREVFMIASETGLMVEVECCGDVMDKAKMQALRLVSEKLLLSLRKGSKDS